MKRLRLLALSAVLAVTFLPTAWRTNPLCGRCTTNSYCQQCTGDSSAVCLGGNCAV